MAEQKSQLDNFKEAARQLETDDDEQRLKERLAKFVKHKPVKKSGMIVAFYLSLRQGSKPEFQDRRGLDALPSVGDHVEISGHEAGKMMRVKVNANSETHPELSGILGDKGAWVICQEN